MHFAAAKGHLDIFELIMEHIHDPSPRNDEGQTPYHFAASYGHTDMCSAIIKILELYNIQDKNPQDNSGNTPLHWAAANGYQGLCNLIYATGKFFSAVFF